MAKTKRTPKTASRPEANPFTAPVDRHYRFAKHRGTGKTMGAAARLLLVHLASRVPKNKDGSPKEADEQSLIQLRTWGDDKAAMLPSWWTSPKRLAQDLGCTERNTRPLIDELIDGKWVVVEDDRERTRRNDSIEVYGDTQDGLFVRVVWTKDGWSAPVDPWVRKATGRNGKTLSAIHRLTLDHLWSCADAPSKRNPGHQRVHGRWVQTARIAEALACSQHTARRSLNRLIAEGLVVEAEWTDERTGRLMNGLQLADVPAAGRFGDEAHEPPRNVAVGERVAEIDAQIKSLQAQIDSLRAERARLVPEVIDDIPPLPAWLDDAPWPDDVGDPRANAQATGDILQVGENLPVTGEILQVAGENLQATGEILQARLDLLEELAHQAGLISADRR